MSRFADLFVATCIVAVSTSVGMVLFYQLELPSTLAVAIVLALLLVLMLVNFRNLRQQDRATLDDSVDRLGRRLDQVTADLDSMERRLSSIETNTPRRTRQEMEPVVAEVEVIGALIRQLVETVADLEAQIGGSTGSQRAMPNTHDRPSLVASPAPNLMAAMAAAGDLVPKRFAQLGEKGFLELVRSSIEANRIDVHLQPIVTLPQRKIRFYEALTRLRTADGETIYPADYIPLAEKAGVMPSLDNQILARSLQILKRLTQRTKDVGIFCNVSTTSLGDGQFFPGFLKFLTANKELADELIFEFAQSPLKTLGPLEYEGLRAIQGLGFRFSIDQVSDLRSSFQFLADRGFRYVKISAERMLNGGQALASDIHPADLAHFFSRAGMELIVDRIESETQVVDVLDYSVKYGQGFLFAPPRPVKTEIFAANADVPQPKPAEDAIPVLPSVPVRPVAPPTAPRRAMMSTTAQGGASGPGDLRQPPAAAAADLRPSTAATVGDLRQPLSGIPGELRQQSGGSGGRRAPGQTPQGPPAAEAPPRGNAIAQMIERRTSSTV
ncbi:MAG: EAL domain-containing protein [Ancalomicrobiaceae bacterium]|nr:EAL domain-containing protein [Ancalomicrobiaceae bacterium]